MRRIPAQYEKTVFWTVDLVRPYHWITSATEHFPMTDIKTLFGLFEFKRKPFILQNAAQTFQHFLVSDLRGLGFVRIHIDNLHISGPKKSNSQHLWAGLAIPALVDD